MSINQLNVEIILLYSPHVVRYGDFSVLVRELFIRFL